MISHQRGSAPLSSFQYKYNKRGERTSKLIESGAGRLLWKYRYDKTGRLLSEKYQNRPALRKELEVEESDEDTEDIEDIEDSVVKEKALAKEKASGNYTVKYSYDENGNRVKRTENGQAMVYRYDAADELLSAGTTSFNWDENGNLIRKIENNATTNYHCDFENHLSQITFPDNSTESYLYNGDGLRVQKVQGGVTTNYLLSGSDVLKEETSGQGGSPSTYYILGGSMSGPLALKQEVGGSAVYHYPLTDAQGSIHILTDESADITDGYSYDAFGNALTLQDLPPNTTYNPYGYTGQQTDATSGLIYLRARYYDPQAGRFITQDPIGFSGGMNFYAYCGGNPILFIDPTGFDVYLVRWSNPDQTTLSGGFGHIAIAVDDPSHPGQVTLIDPRPVGGNNLVSTQPGRAEQRRYVSTDQLIAREELLEYNTGGTNPLVETLQIKTDPSANIEAGILEYRNSHIDFGYNFLSYNCAHYVLDAMRAAGGGGVNSLQTLPFLTPNDIWDCFKKCK